MKNSLRPDVNARRCRACLFQQQQFLAVLSIISTHCVWGFSTPRLWTDVGNGYEVGDTICVRGHACHQIIPKKEYSAPLEYDFDDSFVYFKYDQYDRQTQSAKKCYAIFSKETDEISEAMTEQEFLQSKEIVNKTMSWKMIQLPVQSNTDGIVFVLFVLCGYFTYYVLPVLSVMIVGILFIFYSFRFLRRLLRNLYQNNPPPGFQ